MNLLMMPYFELSELPHVFEQPKLPELPNLRDLTELPELPK
jgi:hypothetical protein